MRSRIELENVTKDYGATRALAAVNLAVPAGTIRGLVGENGAGKSTLAKIIAGDIRPTSGVVKLNGAEVPYLTPASARRAGIAIVHQWGDLVPSMTVEENIFLGNEVRGRFRVLNKGEMRQRARTVLNDLGVEIDSGLEVGDLSPAHRQVVAISKALVRKCDLLIVDEGGVSLDKKEAAFLHSVLRKLRAGGVTIIYISHLLNEVVNLSDEITVLRNGTLVDTLDARAMTAERLAVYVVGHEIHRAPPAGAASRDGNREIALRVRDLSWDADDQGFSFDVQKGEILGIAGPEGAGKSEILRTLFGLMPAARGTVALDGRVLSRRTPRQMLKEGVAFVPEDRFLEGLLLERSVEENISLPRLGLQRRFLLPLQALRAAAARKAAQIKTRMASIDAHGSELSGGNQQKVVVARWLEEGYRLLLLDEPYKGIDIGAKEDINDQLRAMANAGRSVVVISTEFADLIGLVSRLLVVVNRRIVGVLSGDAITSQEIMKYYQSDVGSSGKAQSEAGVPAVHRVLQ
ncbi:MAG TPA: sugar ABC transporter ATP-binding protein [Acetobacteraceae bacterium]|nr:sugar ABC transporter ATP-binding protein [Acetobacteraceae bacterium]